MGDDVIEVHVADSEIVDAYEPFSGKQSRQRSGSRLEDPGDFDLVILLSLHRQTDGAARPPAAPRRSHALISLHIEQDGVRIERVEHPVRRGDLDPQKPVPFLIRRNWQEIVLNEAQDLLHQRVELPRGGERPQWELSRRRVHPEADPRLLSFVPVFNHDLGRIPLDEIKTVEKHLEPA
jgi:hypothetical protein